MIAVEHIVNKRFSEGHFCGCDTEIVVTLPQKQYRRLTRSLGWRSVCWPSEKRRARKSPRPIIAKLETFPVHPPLVLPMVETEVWEGFEFRPVRIADCPPRPIRATEQPPKPTRRTVRPPKPASTINRPPKPALPRPARAAERPSRPRKCSPKDDKVRRITEGQRREARKQHKADKEYILQALREWLAAAKVKENAHAVDLRAVRGPRFHRRHRARRLLPLVRRWLVRPLEELIERLEG